MWEGGCRDQARQQHSRKDFVHRVSSSLLGAVVPPLRRLKLTARRHKFDEDSLSCPNAFTLKMSPDASPGGVHLVSG